MSDSMIAELARQIVETIAHQQWYFYILVIALNVICAFGLSWVNSYASDRGKFKAIEDNFEKVITQLKTTTETTSQIQLTLAHSDWSSREYKTIRRDKMEILMFSLYETRDWVGQALTSHSMQDDFKTETSPFNRLSVIATLYFPEASSIHDEFEAAYHNFVLAVLNGVQPVTEKKNKISELKIWFDAFQAMNSPESVQQARDLLPQLAQASAEYVNVRREFKQALIPFYRELQASFLRYGDNLRTLMQETILQRSNINLMTFGSRKNYHSPYGIPINSHSVSLNSSGISSMHSHGIHIILLTLRMQKTYVT